SPAGPHDLDGLARLRGEHLAAFEVGGDDVPDRRAVGVLVDGAPAGHDVVLLGHDRRAGAQEMHAGDAVAHLGVHADGVAHAAHAHHVAALLIVGVGVEQVVGDVFQDQLDRLAFHDRAIGRRIGDGGGVVDVFPGHGLAWEQ